MTTKELLEKIRELPHSDVGSELTGLTISDLKGLIVAHQEGCHAMGDLSMALCDVEPLEDSVYENNLMGLYLKAGEMAGHHILTLPKVGVDTKRLKDQTEEGDKLDILVAPVRARFIRGVRLVYSVEVLTDILNQFDKEELVIICAVQQLWQKEDGPRVGFTNHVTAMESELPKLLEQTPKGRLRVGSLLPVNGNRDLPELACILNETDEGGANYVYVNSMRQDYEGNPLKSLPSEAYRKLKRCPDEVIYELMMDYSPETFEMFYELQKCAIAGEFQKSYNESRKR